MSDIQVIATNKDFYIFGDGVATQSISIKKATKAARYRVTKGAIDEFIGHLQDDATKISVDMIVHDVIDFAERRIVTTALDKMESLEDSRKAGIENRELWTLYTGLKDDAPDRYGFPFSKTAKTSFSAFKNLMIENVDYSIDNTMKMAGFRIRIDFTEVLTGEAAPEWKKVDWNSDFSKVQFDAPFETETPSLGKETKIKTICDEIGELISSATSWLIDKGKKVEEAAEKGIDWLLGLIPDRCPTRKEITGEEPRAIQIATRAYALDPYFPDEAQSTSFINSDFNS